MHSFMDNNQIIIFGKVPKKVREYYSKLNLQAGVLVKQSGGLVTPLTVFVQTRTLDVPNTLFAKEWRVTPKYVLVNNTGRTTLAFKLHL